ncbi:PD-(D/E)XK nuclease family protein, partial [Oscillatoriales cyanobacterium LEGE 11467]|nr:PD-(D/E)XK nuclease family protein [Zarconia navalis LEGE 11467]
MTRTVYLHLSSEMTIDDDRLTVITPTLPIARSLNVPHQKLETLAQQICQQNGMAIAPVLLAHRTLQTAVKKAIDPTDIEGTARAFSGAVRSILRAGIDLEALASASQQKVRQLAHLIRTYQQQLALQKAIDPAQLLWYASRLSFDLNCDRQPLFVYGYFQPRPDRLAFIDAIAAEGSVMVLPWEAEDIFTDNRAAIDWLQERGWEIVENAPVENIPTEFEKKKKRDRKLDNKNTPPSFSPSPRRGRSIWKSKFGLTDNRSLKCFAPTASPHLHSYPNPEAEVRGVLGQVKQLLSDGVAAGDIVLVARDDAAYGPMVLDVAWEYELPVRALYPVPLAATRLGAWIRLLLEVVGSNFPFEATTKLLSHPLAGGKLKTLWPEIRSRHPQGLRQWQKLGKTVGIDLSVLKWKKKETRSNWVQRLREVFDRFGIRRHCGGWAREIVAYYKFIEGLEAVMQPETERLELTEFVRE